MYRADTAVVVEASLASTVDRNAGQARFFQRPFGRSRPVPAYLPADGT